MLPIKRIVSIFTIAILLGSASYGLAQISAGARGTTITSGAFDGLLDGNLDFANDADCILFGAADDLILCRDAADILAQRRGSNPQESRLYNIDSGADDEYFAASWASNQARLITFATGTGVHRDLIVGTSGGTASLTFRAAGTDFWQLAPADGSLRPIGVDARDLGSTGTEIRTAYFGDGTASVQLGLLQDVKLGRHAADTFQIEGGTPGNTELRILNTANGVNEEYIQIHWDSNTAFIRANKDGAGAFRELSIFTQGGVDLNLGTAGVTRWLIEGDITAGTLVPFVDDTYDIGGGDTRRVRAVVISQDYIIDSNTGQLILGASQDTKLGRHGANVFQMVGASPALTGLRLLNTADGVNEEYLQLMWSGGKAFIQTAADGAGVDRPLEIGTTGPALLTFKQNNLVRMSLNADSVDFTVDIMLAGTEGLIDTVSAAAQANPDTNSVKYYTREDIDQGAGTATDDCALVARLSTGTEILVQVLVIDGGCA